MKKIISLILVVVLCLCFFTGSASAKIAQPTNTLKTNGNGGKTDVGVWFVTYNNNSMWANNFGSGIPIKYRTLMPDGSYGILDSSNIEHIDFQIEQLAKAKVDFVLFDLTNGGLTPDVAYGWESDDGGNLSARNARLTCERIALWNKNNSWKIKYAMAVGAYEALRDNLSIGQAAEYQAKAIYKEWFQDPEIGGDNYYQVDGKPMLILHHWGYNVLTCEGGWNSYKGDRTYGDKFFVRNGQGGEKGTYGWHTRKGTIVDDEVMPLCPGQRVAGLESANIYRQDGDYYLTSWETVLNNKLPRIVMIASFNDYNEQTGVWTADSSRCKGVYDEQWTDSTGQINNSMYWDMTVEGIKLVRTFNGEIKGEWTSEWFNLGNGRPVRKATTTSSGSNSGSSEVNNPSNGEGNSNQAEVSSGNNSSTTSGGNKLTTQKSGNKTAIIIVITVTLILVLAIAAGATIFILKSKKAITVLSEEAQGDEEEISEESDQAETLE